MQRFHTRRRCGALLCVLLLAALLAVPVSAEGDTLTLTGEISGIFEVPEGTTRVILDGVTAADFESGIKLSEPAEVELRDGSENVCGIMAMQALRVTGGGSLLGGSGIYAFGDLTLDLTGSVVLEGGQIAAFSGSVIINSGTYRLQSLPEGGGGLIVASGGDVLLNGGDVQIYNDSVGVTSADGSITVDGAELEISAADAAMIAQTIVLPEELQSAVTLQTNNADGTGQTIAAEGGPAMHVKIGADKAEAAAEPGDPVIRDGSTDTGAAVSLDERTPDAETIAPETKADAQSPAWIWGLIAAGAVILITAVLLLIRKRKKTT